MGFDASKRTTETRKAIDDIDEDAKNLIAKARPPAPDMINLPLTHFYTNDNAVIVMEKITNEINRLKGDLKSNDKENFEMTFEVKMKIWKKEDAEVVGGRVNVYTENEETRRNLVVFTPERDFSSKMWLPRVYNDMMTKLAYLR